MGGNTTEIIQRRIRHWKTTAAGIACIVAPLVAIFCPPEIAVKVLAAASALAGTGLVVAADARKDKTP